MNKNTIFVQHREYNIKENGKFLNQFYANKSEVLKKVRELKSLYPDKEYEYVYVGNDVNDLKMRIVSFLERYSCPKFVIEINGSRLKKIFNHEQLAEDFIEELKEHNPNIDFSIVKIGNGKPFPENVMLEQCDYDLLEKDGKIHNNTTFGMNVLVKRKVK